MQTTPAKARVLKSEADKFFSRLLRIHARFESAADAKRESIRYVKSMLFTENAGKKALDEWLPKFQEEGVSTWFVQNYKLGFRPWDAAEKILVKLI